jgi:peptidoglycan/LPS O-acetylase OafA/YrhL
MPNTITPAVSEPSVAAAARPDAKRNVFFPNLNGLRFLAALLVIISHVEMESYQAKQTTYLNFGVINTIGHLGVTLFFVLSGFLITYLLLAEKEVFGRINFGAFYMRRIVRIWPLYYAVVVLSLFVLPHFPFFQDPALTPSLQEHLGGQTILHLLILPNVAQVLYPAVPYLGQTWSIGVEEQFYIVWPILVHFSSRYFRNFLLFALGIYVLMQLSWFLTAPGRHILPETAVTDFIKKFLFFFRIQCMAIGGMFALVLFQNWARALKLLTARPVQVIVWVALVVLIFRGQTFRYFTHEVYGVLFGILVLNLAITETSIANLRHPVLNYLGKISYGLYMLHYIAITVAVWVANKLVPTGIWHHPLTYLVTLVVAIALAAGSYTYLEMPFLRLKKRYTRIHSGS